MLIKHLVCTVLLSVFFFMSGAGAADFSDARAKELLSVIKNVEEDGLKPSFYRADEIEALLTAEPSPDRTAKLEKLVEQSFRTLASNFYYGRLDPFTFKIMKVKDVNVEGDVRSLLPQTAEYKKMKTELARYRKLAEGEAWPKIPKCQKDQKFYKGDTDARIGLTKRRLIITGELKSIGADENLFDENLEEALKKFQAEHGLFVDGVLGDNTVYDLNKDAKWWGEELIVNLDRVRAFTRILNDEKYIVVNIPNFEVDVIENGEPVLNAKAIVGRITRETPLMHDKVRFIVFSPKWRVPKTIAVKDKLPEIKKNPEFLEKNDMAVFKNGENGLEEVDVTTIDWSQVTEENFDYTIVQDSGDGNALGHIKFMFPNKDDVYMHDTPTKNLFERTTRIFSSGCVRMNKPVEMAGYLLKDKPEWTKEKIVKEMNRPKELFVNLTKPVPIYLIYQTAWTDKDGTVQFRRDVYNYDRLSKQQLVKK